MLVHGVFLFAPQSSNATLVSFPPFSTITSFDLCSPALPSPMDHGMEDPAECYTAVAFSVALARCCACSSGPLPIFGVYGFPHSARAKSVFSCSNTNSTSRCGISKDATVSSLSIVRGSMTRIRGCVVPLRLNQCSPQLLMAPARSDGRSRILFHVVSPRATFVQFDSCSLFLHFGPTFSFLKYVPRSRVLNQP
jgi:hypothetical protein